MEGNNPSVKNKTISREAEINTNIQIVEPHIHTYTHPRTHNPSRSKVREQSKRERMIETKSQINTYTTTHTHIDRPPILFISMTAHMPICQLYPIRKFATVGDPDQAEEEFVVSRLNLLYC